MPYRIKYRKSSGQAQVTIMFHLHLNRFIFEYQVARFHVIYKPQENCEFFTTNSIGHTGLFIRCSFDESRLIINYELEVNLGRRLTARSVSLTVTIL